MIIYDFNVKSVSRNESKTDPPLPVYPNTVMPSPVSSQLLESIRRWYSKLLNIGGNADPDELLKGATLNIQRQTPGELLLPNFFRFFARETPDHLIEA